MLCYLFSVVLYGCETWTYSKAIYHKINGFEMLCCRRMVKISCTSHTTNKQRTVGLLQKIGVKETTMLNNLNNRKLPDSGYVMRITSGHYDTLLTTIVGRLEGQRGRGRPTQRPVDDLRTWTGSKRYGQIKRGADRRNVLGTFATHNNGPNTE